MRSNECISQIHFLDKSRTLEMKLIKLNMKCKRFFKSCKYSRRSSKIISILCIIITIYSSKKRSILCIMMMKYARFSCVKKYFWSTSTICWMMTCFLFQILESDFESFLLSESMIGFRQMNSIRQHWMKNLRNCLIALDWSFETGKMKIIHSWIVISKLT